MPVCRNRECSEDFVIPFGSLWGKSFSYGEKEVRKLLCEKCRDRIQKFIDDKAPDEREYWKPIRDTYFCWTCKKIDFSFDGSHQDNKKYCKCRNGLTPSIADYDEGYVGGEDW